MREGAGDDSDQILRVVLSDSPVREVLPLAPERRLLLFLGPVLILGLAIRQNTLCVSGKSDPFLELLEFCPPCFAVTDAFPLLLKRPLGVQMIFFSP